MVWFSVTKGKCIEFLLIIEGHNLDSYSVNIGNDVCLKRMWKKAHYDDLPSEKLRCAWSCGWNVTFSPHRTKGFCRDCERERGRKRRGEAEYVGSQSSGSTYRMSVVNIHTAGHETSQTHTQTQMQTPSHIPTSVLQTDNRGTHA